MWPITRNQIKFHRGASFNRKTENSLVININTVSTVFGYCFLLNLPTNHKVAICTPNRRIFDILGVVNWEISVRLPVKDVLTSCRHEEAFGTFSVPRAEGPRRLGRNGSRWGSLERQTDFHCSFNSTINLKVSITIVIKCVLQLSNL